MLAVEENLYNALNRLDKKQWDGKMFAWYHQYVSDMDVENRAEHEHQLAFKKLFKDKNES